MDGDGDPGRTGHARESGAASGGAARGAPQAPVVPPRPTRAPGTSDGSAFLTWLRTPRPQALPGVWRFGHRPRPEEEPERVPGRQLLSGAVIAFLVGWLIWSLLWNGYLGGWWLLPLFAMIPDSWAEPHSFSSVVVVYAYYALVAGVIMVGVGRLGRWSEIWRRYGPPAWRRAAPGAVPPPAPDEDPAAWPELRAAGAHDAAERLAADARSGLMRDVDHARIARAWQGVQRGRHSLATFTGAVLSHGAGACPHPSGARDLPVRQARHDLVTGQVRIGTAADDARNPYAYRGAGLALGPDLLGTSLLAVGPAGSGKTGSLVRPLTESLCLHALAGRAAVVVVGAAGSDLGPADAYDVVVRIGNPDSVYDLDLYGGTTDPDEAAAVLAEALVGDLADPHQGGDTRRSTTVLAQLLGPFRAVHGRFPACRSCGSCSTARPRPLAALRQGLRGGRAGVPAAGTRRARAADGAARRRRRHPGRPGGAAGPARLRRVLRHLGAVPAVHPQGARPPGPGARGPARAGSRRRLADAGPAGPRPVHRERRGA
ncbi:ATP-binding protein OS=Streptomyces tendae OX=1932 GN=GUR47_37950 PE=4 SV=1 [Streptomyces tendae]